MTDADVVIDWLLDPERATGGTRESRAARRSGEKYLLERHLFRRLSTGQPADERYLDLVHPSRWHYHVLRGLDYFGSVSALTGQAPDPRLVGARDDKHIRHAIRFLQSVLGVYGVSLPGDFRRRIC